MIMSGSSKMTAIATERVTILVSPKEKAEFETKARRLGLRSVGELVRRSVRTYPPRAGAAANGASTAYRRIEADLTRRSSELNALLALLESSNRRANEALDLARAELRATRAYFARKTKR
jgi:hypothetical protein